MLKEDKSACSKLEIPNCKTHIFVNDFIECGECEIGYQKVKKKALINLVEYNTVHCDEDNGNYDVPRCKTYLEGICIECEDEGYEPIRINNG